MILLHGNGEDGSSFCTSNGLFQQELSCDCGGYKRAWTITRGTAPFTIAQFAEGFA